MRLVDAAIGLAIGLAAFGLLAYLMLHPPAGYRRAMGYPALTDRPADQQRRMRRFMAAWVVTFALITASVAAWALPAVAN